MQGEGFAAFHEHPELHTFGAFGGAGLSASDQQRILSNGIAESLYNLMFAIVLGGPGLVLGSFGRGR